MFAVVESGGKQYRVTEGDVLKLESIKAEPGETVDLPVMMLGGDDVQVGTPLVEGASVKAEVVEHGRGKKIYIYKFKAKSNYRRKNGHRQDFTEVKITEILDQNGKSKKAEAKVETQEVKEVEAKAVEAEKVDAPEAKEPVLSEAKAQD